MRHALLTFLLLFNLGALAASTPATAAPSASLAVGSMAPSFSAQASLAGKDFSFSLPQALAKGPVVVYFFPSAFTRGCDLEAHTFATQMEQFTAAGARVIGVSADSIERLHAFSKDPAYCAGKFPVASDPSGSIASRYGLSITPIKAGLTDVRGQAVNHILFERATFVIDAHGKIVARMSSTDGLTPIDHVEQSLAIVSRLKASAK